MSSKANKKPVTVLTETDSGDIDLGGAQVRNGCSLVTRSGLQGICLVGMDHAESMAALFSAITKLADGFSEIQGLSRHGETLAMLLGSDLDCLQEQAVYAGLQGYLVPEKSNG